MENEVKEYYDLLSAVCKWDDSSLNIAYRRMRELLEHLCHTQIADSSLQMTDLSARINFVASKIGLSITEQNRLHTFRLTSNGTLNRQVEPRREQLLRDVKTLAFFIKRLTGEDIPAELYRLLPHADATYIVASPAKEHIRRMRVSFRYADDNYLYVFPIDSLADEPLRVRYNVPQINGEFAETCRLLWSHAQVNLLDVSVDEAGILTPSFIILEPDYLIDISSLAECFKDYGHHPANYILARLQSPDNTRPLLLGNIANLFLDEWIHSEKSPDYLSCMKKAFRSYPIELAACADLKDREKEAEFFADCKRHFENIRQTVTETFRAAGYGLDKTDAVLEPSYICEALGLQGRLDYMQRDMSSFIEMKSGKADEYTIRGKVEPKENNRVQMLLYQAVLEYSMGMDHRQVKAYLLYTRYPLLYPARPSWAMVRRVMDVRNRIVANEYGIQLRNSSQYTAERLKDIHPDILNERQLDNALWKRYLYPSIDAVTQRILALSPIERSYFYTLYNFITKELYTSKSGDMNYEGRAGAAALWLSTLAEKSEAGEILYDLTIRDNHAADVHKPYLVFSLLVPSSRSEGEALPNFRQGDAVVLYERNKDSDNVTNKMVFKGNIERISDNEICMRLRATQQNAGVLPSDSRYAIEHDCMDTSFRGMYLGLSAFLSATKSRRDLLLGQRPPAFDSSFDSRIAASQDDFARVILKARAASDYFLLIGPPGTGKTSRALRGMVEAFYQEGKQILLLSYTNRAVDEICKALVAITPETDFIRIGSELSCDEKYRGHLIENVLDSCSTRLEVQDRIARCYIFVGTVATLSAKTELFRLKTFDVAIVDEATQILEPQLLGLLCSRNPAGMDAIGKFILIGDHKQLPAVVLQSSEQSEVNDESLRDIGLHNLKDSLFERLYRNVMRRNLQSPMSHLEPCYDMLCRQGRMNVEVALFPNRAFYGGLLQSVGLPHQQGELFLPADLCDCEFADLLTRRVAFLPSVPEELAQSAKMNHSEARIVARLAGAVYRQYSAMSCFDSSLTLGIIAPYRSQIALIKNEIAALGIAGLDDVLVDTVERFQGSERDVIIYSFCVNRISQLKFLANLTEDNGVLVDRKLNVALTRARKQMFMTGVPQLLKLNPIYARLLETVAYDC
ncbi:AAA domain-containing protein [Bacteroides helcogenes]|uniref:DNA helicase n=1 Tax=Bacteroides helcogenes (strain ATCC 35417 / DSM 20613 / JCM 6297 / CCUG 15421 / P 36-108) TaxID=693979 RepID=E6SU31_BACT6|nr:AAA domain-containing protein [Bacteroides helcogenes]ADV43332.1 DNA helicase [Bacteroides helcogenes P 36-108]MDY5238101.1 AAA domain-containing protein [Bacteroides helcogenes]